MPKNKEITINDLTFAYDQQKNIFQNLSWQFQAGKFYLLIGKTGCGKSTLMKILAGLYPKYGGHLTGRIDLANLKVAMMFQNAAEQFTMKTLREEIIFALENLNLNHDEYERRLKKAVTFTQTSRLLDQAISTLSGGEKQRAALSVLIAMDVDLLLLDEPFASCDPETRKFLIGKLNDLVHLGKTVIITDHIFDNYKIAKPVVYQLTANEIKQVAEAEKKQLFSKVKIKTDFPIPREELQPIFSFKNTEIHQNHLLLSQKRLLIPTKKIILITGKNGVGKSSLFKALTQMLPYAGGLYYNKKDIAKLKPRKYLTEVGQIFQNSEDQFLKITVQDEIELSKKNANSYFTDHNLQEALQLLELGKVLDRVVYSLSGGQKKKLQILIMLMEKHRVLLLDEPLAGLDRQSTELVIDLIKRVKKKTAKTMLIISHQVDSLNKLCDYHLVFEDQELRYVH